LTRWTAPRVATSEELADQLLPERPGPGAGPGYADYRSPIAGLYQASSATHGGGGVCGIPGWQAFRAIQADRRKAKRRR
jgi:phytoene dehydrogenase-like protein